MKRCLYLRYYAVRDKNGKYLGCLEVAQDVTEIRSWTEEKKKFNLLGCVLVRDAAFSFALVQKSQFLLD